MTKAMKQMTESPVDQPAAPCQSQLPEPQPAVLWQGQLWNSRTGQLAAARMTGLEARHIPAIRTLQALVAASLPDPDLYVVLTDEELSYISQATGGQIHGIWVDDQLIAQVCLYYPDQRPDNLGRDLGLAAGDLAQMLHLEGISVHPDYRGNDLGMLLTMQALHLALQRRPVRFLAATASPDNYVSLVLLFAAGLTIRALRVKYGHCQRYILLRDLAADPAAIAAPETPAAPPDPATPVTLPPPAGQNQAFIDVAHTDLPTQQLLLQQGYIGSAVLKTQAGWQVRFAAPAPGEPGRARTSEPVQART